MSETIRFVAMVTRLPADEVLSESTREMLVEQGQRAKHESDAKDTEIRRLRALEAAALMEHGGTHHEPECPICLALTPTAEGAGR
jgi:hypothetical protein